MLNTRSALLEINLRWLAQALDMLKAIDDRQFRAPQSAGAQCICSQLRHIAEQYECFLNGLDSLHIDYAAGTGDTETECSPADVTARIQCVMTRLQIHPALEFDNVIFVRAEEAEALGLEDPYLMSSVARELMAISSHTVHHLGWIGVVQVAPKMPVEPAGGLRPRRRAATTADAA